VSGIKIPQLFIIAFLLLMLVMAGLLGIPLGVVVGDSLVRLAMNGVLVLSLLPMLNAGIGINFGLPVGICAGLLGMCLAVNWRGCGLIGFVEALLFSMPVAIVFGTVYSRILNRVKGREEIAATFVGFSFIPLMNFFWTVAPFRNPAMLWPIGGKGLRPSIGLKSYFGKALNDLWAVSLHGLTMPLGLLLFFGLLCLLTHLFFRTKFGRAMIAVGENETFALISGVDVRRIRAIAVILSTIIGAWGICVYAQSYGFIELYDAPMVMAFPAASAVLVGGSMGHRTTVLNVILGTYLFQTVYILSGPLANELLVPEVAEIIRMFISNGIILGALLHEGTKSSHATV